MVAVKDTAASAAKYIRNAGQAGAEYATNSQAAAQLWSTNTQAAAPTYQQAISAPGVPARFASGVRKAGSAKYAAKIAAVGQNRYVEGVGASGDAWQKGFQPFAQALGSLTLSPRRPRGDRANYRRSEESGVRSNATRLAQLGTPS